MKNELLKRISPLLQFLPLSIFALIAFSEMFPLPERWTIAYGVGATLALARLIYLIRKKVIINRLILGADLYLLIGFTAVILGLTWATNVLAHFQASLIFICIFCVGIFSTIFSKFGFVGVESPDFKAIRKYSFIFLLVTVGAFFFAYDHRGDRNFGAVFPIILLVLIQRTFVKQKKLRSGNTTRTII
jgi:peptidoglycan/LPS O-acetylase OafA/YrhL